MKKAFFLSFSCLIYNYSFGQTDSLSMVKSKEIKKNKEIPALKFNLSEDDSKFF